MDDSELTAFLGRKIQSAMNREDGDISRQRSKIFTQYYGGKQGNEREGKSTFVTREVMETVEWAMPSILRVLYGSNRVVAFEPVGAEDMEAAQQETDVINYKVRRANGGDGFVAMNDFVKDSLLNPTAYLKVWMEEEERSTVHEVEGITAEQLHELTQDKKVELLEQRVEVIQVPIPSEPGAPPQLAEVEVFDIKYREKRDNKIFRIMGVPPEEVLVDPDLLSLDLNDASFVCHRSLQHYTHLVNMGYDKKKLGRIGSSLEEATWNDERVTRLFYEDESPSHVSENDTADDDSMRQLWVYECTAWVDYDGDGLAEYRRIVMIGNEIFENEETDYQPLVAMSSILIPHKHNGMSMSELASEPQKLLTELTRQLIDNVYALNNRRKFITENVFTNDGGTQTAMNSPVASVVPCSSNVNLTASIMHDPTVPIINELLPVIQDQRQALSLRTGIAPENSVDPAVLQQSTYGAFMGAMEKANERLELIIRIMAETGIKQLYRKAHQLIRMYPDMVETIQLRDKWIPVDPRGWRERTDVKVNVGLGFANKQQLIASSMQMLEIQQQVAGSGLADEKNVYNALTKVVENSGLGATELMFKDPSAPDWQPPQPQPDPQAVLAQAQADSLAAQTQIEQFKAQSAERQAMAKMQHESVKAATEAEAKRIDGEVKMREIGIREKEQEIRHQLNQIEMLKTTAEIQNTEADTGLKEAMTTTEFVEAGKKDAEIEKIGVEASDEYRKAKQVNKNGRSSDE